MAENGDEYNRGGLIAFSGSVAFCLIFFVYISFIHQGVDLREVAEEAAAESSAEAAPGAVGTTQNNEPWVESEEMIAHGAKVYKNNCAICHGDKGMGDGPAGAALVPPARNLVEGKWKAGGTSSELFATIQSGLPGTSMAPFKHLPKTDRWALVQFIRSITQNKEADDAATLATFGATAE